MRGTPSFGMVWRWWTRIIPACAGNTAQWTSRTNRLRDHPRVCGEHRRACRQRPMIRGSSPRVRGTPYRYRDVVGFEGIIPACAGNTHGNSGLPRDIRDHPRVCGEHGQRCQPAVPQLGSSPRVRGTLAPEQDAVRRSGIIPACAGNTYFELVHFLIYGDHPRVCGEHISPESMGRPELGSSPRVRGTHSAPTLIPPTHGIIPACAGNTILGAGTGEEVGDHPRVCGEHPSSGFVR